MKTNSMALPITILAVVLLAYCVAVGMMFRRGKGGLRRRWLPLDYIWVPLGGITVGTLLALWWHLQ